MTDETTASAPRLTCVLILCFTKWKPACTKAITASVVMLAPDGWPPRSSTAVPAMPYALIAAP